MVSHASDRIPAQAHHERGDDSHALIGVVAVLLGVAVAVLAVVAVWMGSSAHDASRQASAAADRASAVVAGQHSSMPGMSGMTGGQTAAGAVATPSYAGMAPANADAIAEAHVPYPATLPPAAAGPVANVHLVLKDVVHDIAPGIKYNAWTFAGGAPGPVVHVRQGQTVRDHAHQRRCDSALGRLSRRADRPERRLPGREARRVVHLRLHGHRPGRSSCTTAGPSPCSPTSRTACTARSSSTPATPLPRADREYVLVSSEWYLERARPQAARGFVRYGEGAALAPDWVTWNGYAGQYVKHPLTANAR